MPRLSLPVAPTRIISHLIHTKRSFGFPLFLHACWGYAKDFALSYSSCLMFIFLLSIFYSFLLHFVVFPSLFLNHKMPTGVRDFCCEEAWPRTVSIHIQDLYIPEAFLFYCSRANKVTTFTDLQRSEHMHQLSQWLCGSETTSISNEGNTNNDLRAHYLVICNQAMCDRRAIRQFFLSVRGEILSLLRMCPKISESGMKLNSLSRVGEVHQRQVSSCSPFHF